MKRILCIILVFSCMLYLSACSPDNVAAEINPSKNHNIMQTELAPDTLDICGAWITKNAGRILILNDNSSGVFITLGQTEYIPYYDVHILEFSWENDKERIIIYSVNDDGSLEDEEKYSYEINNSELLLPELFDNYPLKKMPSTNKTETTIVGDWKAYGTSGIFISFHADGTWCFEDGIEIDGITYGEYSINSNEPKYYTEATICDVDGRSLGYVRLLGNGFLEFQDGMHSWLLEY